jgi:aspartyl-tRNA synthetase
MLRTHTCGELRLSDANKQATLTGWVQRLRDKGSVVWLDLRDRYGITQLIFEEGKTEASLFAAARQLGREFVIQVEGVVTERLSKNDKIPTGEIELKVSKLTILNTAKLPPFSIEDDTDGGEELRMNTDTLI